MPTKTRTSSSVLGPDGNLMKVTTLTQEHAGPTTGGVRSVWSDNMASGLDPAKLASILKRASEGENQDFLTLAEDMEERDPHYASVLGQRKRAITGITPIVTPTGSSPLEVEIANAVEALIATSIFESMIDDLLDGIAKGYSVVEPIWDTNANFWTPLKYAHRDQRHFQFDKLTGRELRIREQGEDEGVSVKPFTMIVHEPRQKSGLTVRGGIARVVAWCFMLKSYTLQDWAAFLEVFGMPLRVGTYDNDASPEEKRILLRAVRDLASDAAAIIPKGMEITFVEAAGGQGNAVFGAMAEYLDKQISKAVIGQTMTTDEGSSNSQSQTHDEVRLDIKKADAKHIGTTVTRDLVTPFVAFNWGPDAPVPPVSFPVEDPEDIKLLTEALDKVVPLGVRIPERDVAKRLGFRTPEKGEAILTMPDRQTAPADDPSESAKASAIRPVCPGCGETHLAASEDDPLVSEALESWEADMSPIIEGILEAAASSDSYEAFLAKLKIQDADLEGMTDTLAAQLMKARGDGVLDAG